VERAKYLSVLVVAGTRPEIVKMGPVITELERTSTPYVFLNSGQHYDFELSQLFIQELGLPEPNINLRLSASNPSEQIAEMILKISRIIRNTRPTLVAVQGDTNTVLATALAANREGAKVAHVEAGLRSYDLRMPEEYNRRLADHLSDVLFAPTHHNKQTLLGEKVCGRIEITGNTVVDAIQQYWHLAQNESIDFPYESYILATIHRAENVDSKDVLREFVRVFKEAPFPVVLPLHPRTKKRLKQFGLWRRLIGDGSQVQVLKPVGYLRFLRLMKYCTCILTDSGGVQEEVTSPLIRKRFVLMRISTERPEAVKAGFGVVAGCKAAVILRELGRVVTMKKPPPARSPYGDGRASRRICTYLRSTL